MLGLDEARRIVERHFRVYDAREERIQGEATAHLFFLMFPSEEFDRRYEQVRRDFAAIDPELVVFPRSEGGEDVLFVAKRPPVPPRKLGIHALLLGLTVITTMMAGALLWSGFRSDAREGIGWGALVDPVYLGWGFVTFALPLLLVLGIHETAHAIAARRHGLRASLPFFLPFPPFIFPIGTLGAFISLRDPMPDRNALFDVGASGPLAGFLAAVPVVVLGLFLTSAAAVALPDHDRPELGVPDAVLVDPSETGRIALSFEDLTPREALVRVTAPDTDGTWSYTLTAVARVDGDEVRHTHDGALASDGVALHWIQVPEGASSMRAVLEWDDGLLQFGDPLLVRAFTALGWQTDGYLTHPTFFAGWVGLLVTGINLLPIGQLDGGHVARAVFGERMRYVAYAAMLALLVLVLFMQSWILMLLFILLIGVQHPPPLNDRTPLSKGRVAAAVFVLVVFIITFVPQPVVG